MKDLIIRMWFQTRTTTWPVKHGFSKATEDVTATFRLGPMVLGWERYED